MSGPRWVRLPTPAAAAAIALALPLTVTAGASAAAATKAALPTFATSTFSHPTRIDNPFFPLVPGMRYRYDGFADLGDGLLPHRNVFTVTNLTKVIDGVRTRVIYDVDLSAGQVVEAELAFFAQDDAGNVWALGEYPEEYEDGAFSEAPDVWIAGLSRAKAGIAMLAHPRVGLDYSQGFAPAIEFADRATVFARGEHVRVPLGDFRRVLVTDEYDAMDPSGGHQRKDYAPGVGNIKVTPVGGDLETLSLDRLLRLHGVELQRIDRLAIAKDRRGHRVSRVYSQTAPLRHGHPH